MTHKQKINWILHWAHKNKVRLELEGECGFGRDECVGIIAANDCFPDYEWYNEDYDKRIDNNGEVWTPPDAYHKYECVAVLGRGKNAESQLYDWLKWFDDNKFIVEVVPVKKNKPFHPLELLMGKDRHARMIRS